MKVWTSCFSKLKNLPEIILPVSITRLTPNGWNGENYKKVYPKGWLLVYKLTGEKDLYKKRYETILKALDPNEIYSDLETILKKYPNKKEIAFICNEEPGEFCHRKILADFLSNQGKFSLIEEWSEEKDDEYKLLRKVELAAEKLENYEHRIFDFNGEWSLFSEKSYPKKEGIYLTIRCGLSGIYTSVNNWDYYNNRWEMDILDNSRVIAFRKEQITDLDFEQQ